MSYSIPYELITKALRRYIDPPIRGRHSKKKRLRKKALKKFKTTIAYGFTQPMPDFLKSKAPESSWAAPWWTGGAA